jgi:hypothetical protein
MEISENQILEFGTEKKWISFYKKKPFCSFIFTKEFWNFKKDILLKFW